MAGPAVHLASAWRRPASNPARTPDRGTAGPGPRQCLPTRERAGRPPGTGCVLAVACGRQQGGDECVTMLHALPGMPEIWQSCGLLLVTWLPYLPPSREIRGGRPN